MTKEDYAEWKRDPRTEAWFKALEAEEIVSVDRRVEVDLSSVEKTALMAVYRAGIVNGCDRCINFVPEGAQS